MGFLAGVRVGSGLAAAAFIMAVTFGATVVQWPAWVAGTVVGVFFPPPAHLAHALGLDVVFPAFFLVLLVDELRGSRAARLAAGIAATVAAGLALVVPAGVALIGATVGALVGLRRERPT